ncbi:MAG: cysteine--tRNA ligase [Acidobacteria bacterium]|nr:MAG: cysteine--tRNA ligase [Acidobacteriota bacterium]
MLLFNTLGQKLEEFKPLEPGKVRLYTCGPTVHDRAHIGNFRTFMFEDILRRYLAYKSYDVNHIMNITDVDDKTILKARKQNLSLREYTEIYTQAFFDDRDVLKILPAHDYPRATDYIPGMIEITEKLLEKGNAYQSRDSVYFRITSFPNYGKLSGIDASGLIDGYRVDSDEYTKESPKDFVLWKGYKEGEDFWESPFGKGRPGWHIECSAMSYAFLGIPLDIHCGGVDNIFPHHENEIAQSEAAFGTKFVNYWLHSAHLIIEGEKMAKSLGNFRTVRDLLELGYDPTVLRYMLMSVHYRKQLNFGEDTLNQAKGALGRLRDFLYRLKNESFGEGKSKEVEKLAAQAVKSFEESMDDDLNISGALAAMFEFIREINKLADAKSVLAEDIPLIRQLVKRMDQVFGVATFPEDSISDEIESWIEKRNEARRKKDFKLSDEIRDKLKAQGIILEDTPTGTRWKKV